jgi:hypothetical protein
MEAKEKESMNERIKELAEQAGVLGVLGTAKFAELIINECLTKCEFVATMAEMVNDGEMARKTKATADSCAKLIKEHFGSE